MDLKGTGVALITPFTASGAVDFKALASITDRVIEGGADYILVLGTTSEYPTLTPEERTAVVRFVKERTAGRAGLMIGIGGYCTESVIETLRTADLSGYGSILSVCPYYNKPSQEGLFRHFSAIAENSPLPIVLYNIPGRTGVNLLPQTVVRLAESHRNIVGIKEASGNTEQMRLIHETAPEGFSLICGDDGIAPSAVKVGAVGVISVLAHICPERVCSMIRKSLDGDIRGAEADLEPVKELVSALFAEGNPVGVKAVLEQMGLCTSAVRLPLAPASDALKERIKGILNTLNM